MCTPCALLNYHSDAVILLISAGCSYSTTKAQSFLLAIIISKL